MLVATQNDGLYQLQLRDDGRGVVAAYPFLYSHPDKSKHGPLRDVCVSSTGRIFVVSRDRMEDGEVVDKIFEILSTDFNPESDGIAGVDVRNVIPKLELPNQLACENDSIVWVAERRGFIARVDASTGTIQRVADLRSDVAVGEEAGLLGLALHPNFADSSFVFASYTYGDNNTPSLLRVVRYGYNPTDHSLTDTLVLVEGIPAGEERNGGRLTVSGGALLVAVGDAGRVEDVQTENSLTGKIIRIGLDGSIPQDNPKSEASYPQSLVWSTGLGNPVGTIVAPSNVVYTIDAGQDGTKKRVKHDVARRQLRVAACGRILWWFRCQRTFLCGLRGH